MKSSKRGNRTSGTSKAKVGRVSARGLWLHLGEEQRFLPFRQFPWFRGASKAALSKVTRPSADHVRWPALDVDLCLDSIEHPERYPLVARVLPPRSRRVGATARP